MTGNGVLVGAAAREITPPVGLPMAGYSGREGGSNGVLDPLYARGLTIRHGGTGNRFAILILDLVAVDLEVLQIFRRRVGEEVGVDAGHVIVTVTHTHSGPAYGSFVRWFGLGMEEESPSGTAWTKKLPDAMIETLKEAVASEQQAGVGFARAGANIAVNRRYKDPTGEVRLAPNPNGLVDPEVSILQAVSVTDKRPLATLVNTACHPVVLCEDNLSYSGDYPAYAIRRLEESIGGIALFANGACGNINPRSRGDATTAKALGEALAGTVVRALDDLNYPDNLQVAFEEREVELEPISLPSDHQLEAYVQTAQQLYDAHADADNYEGSRLFAELERARAMARRIDYRRNRLTGLLTPRSTVAVHVHTARLGPAAIVALPGENFIEFGLDIKARSGGVPTFVLGYSNEAIGYLPTENAFPEGGYEVTSSMFVPGTGEKLIEEVLAGLDGIHDDVA